MTAPEYDTSAIFRIERPHPKLMFQYFLHSFRALLFFPFMLSVLFIKYKTLRYHFDEEGIRMSWGFIYRREISLTYTRIQDIHISRGIIERWLGLATLSIQTASAQAGAEMAIQGLEEYDILREFLYARMRGRYDKQSAANASVTENDGARTLELLTQIHQDLTAIRSSMASRSEQPTERNPYDV